MREPKVSTENDIWNKKNGLRITVHTLHDGFSAGNMYSIEHARILAKKLNDACDEVEAESQVCKEAFLSLGRNLGYISS